MDDRIIPDPVFFKHTDVPRRNDELRSLEVCKAVAKVIECSSLIDGAQKHKGLWKIYLKAEDTRVKLLSNGLTLRGKRITLYDQDPRSREHLKTVTERIVIKDIPLSVHNDVIFDSLKQIAGDTRFTSPMKYSVERDEDGTRTEFKNGDRFIFAEAPISPPLPVDFHVGDCSGRLYHDSQEQTCRVCGETGHRFKSDSCPAYGTNLNHFPFKSHENKLSNFWPCYVQYRDQTFNSAEHAWYHTIATELGLPDVAKQIKSAKHAGAAKAIANKHIPREMIENWEDQCGKTVMTEIVQSKVYQNEDVAKYLRYTGTTILVEATPNKVWGCGLYPHQVRVTKKDYWPGENLLGQILMDIRTAITSTSFSDELLFDQEWEDEHQTVDEYIAHVNEDIIKPKDTQEPKTNEQSPEQCEEPDPLVQTLEPSTGVRAATNVRGRQIDRIQKNSRSGLSRSHSLSSRPAPGSEPISKYFKPRDSTPVRQSQTVSKPETPKRRASTSPSAQKSTKQSKNSDVT